MKNLDPLDIVQRHRDIAVVVARLRVVDANAVNEDEHLAEVGATYRKIRLHAANAAGTHVNRRHEPQHVGDRMRRQRLDLLARDHGERARHRAHLNGGGRGRDDHHLPVWRYRLGRRRHPRRRGDYKKREKASGICR